VRLRTIFITALMLAACGVAVSRLVAGASNQSSAILYTAAKQFDPLAWMHGGERFPLGATILVRAANQVRPLAPDFAASADPNVSFDGKSVLFAGKVTPADPWQIWEVALDGESPRRVVSAAEDLVRPMYLPEDRIVYAHKRNGQFVIEAVSLGGGDPLRLFYAPGSALPSDVLRDGRVLFEAGYPLGSGSTPELYTVYSDGSGVESYRCDHGHARHSGRQIASGDIVFTGGSGLARFTSPLASEVGIAAPAGEYAGDVMETSAGEWVVAWRASEKAPFELKQWKPGAGTLTALSAEPGMNLLQPARLEPRPVPNRHPSGLHEWPTANLMTLNAYLSKRQPSAPTLKAARAQAPLAEGSIASVRLYTVGESGQPKVLGTAPVERDGSFFIQVPGNRPLKFELLDTKGRTLKKQDGWMWARAGEQRICVGCHTGPERAPDNTVPAILLRSTTPADLSGGITPASTGGH
jgi:hypothetical protein